MPWIKNEHYEAKLCILCIVSGIRNRPKSDRSRFPQHWYFSLILSAVLDSTNKYLSIVPRNRSKNRQVCGIRNCICGILNSFWNPQTNDKTFVSLNWAVAESATVSGTRKLLMESANCKWNLHYVCGFPLHIFIKIISFKYMIWFH